MSTKLYCGNLPYNTTEDALQGHFSKAGKVQSVRIVMDKMTGKSKGFAFVEMSSAEEAQEAIEQLNDVEFDGRSLRISEARPQEPRTGGGGGRGGYSGGGDRGGRGGGDRGGYSSGGDRGGFSGGGDRGGFSGGGDRGGRGGGFSGGDRGKRSRNFNEEE